MPEGGELSIGLEHVDNEAERALRGGVLGAGRFVRLMVRDQGMGIDPIALPRIFEPFYSTKALGKGTGLGLSIAHGVALSHGGAIDVETRGGGTCFWVYLPASSAPAPATEVLRPGTPLGPRRDDPRDRRRARAGRALAGPAGRAGLRGRGIRIGRACPRGRPRITRPLRRRAHRRGDARAHGNGAVRAPAQATAGRGRSSSRARMAGKDSRPARCSAGASRLLRKPYRKHELATALAEELGAALATS